MSAASTPASYQDAIRQLAVEDPSIMVLTAENRASIRALPAALGHRFVDVGICEQTMIGVAAGLALRGRKPIVHALAAFLTMRAFEFIRTDIGIPRLPVVLVGAVAGVHSEANGPTHQALEDVALMRGIPGMHVFCPSDEGELVRALPALLASDSPCYVRHTGAKAALTARAPFAIGKAEVVAEGKDVLLLVTGTLLAQALVAREVLATRGLSARVVDVRMPKPFDAATVLAACRDVQAVVTIEDHFVTGGLYTILCETLVRAGKAMRVIPIAFEERWFRPAMLADVMRHERLTGEQLAERIHRSM